MIDPTVAALAGWFEPILFAAIFLVIGPTPRTTVRLFRALCLIDWMNPTVVGDLLIGLFHVSPHACHDALHVLAVRVLAVAALLQVREDGFSVSAV